MRWEGWSDDPFVSHGLVFLSAVVGLFVADAFSLLGAVHILRQPGEGGGGVWQMLTIADEGGREGPKFG